MRSMLPLVWKGAFLFPIPVLSSFPLDHLPEVGSRHQTVSLSIPGLRGLSGLSPMDYIFYSDNLKR
jgi:hypothetical protein